MTRHDAGIIDADAVREAAKKAGLTLTQLSAMCGKSDSWLSMVLTYSAKGKQSSIGIIQLISDALGVHVDAIVDRWIETEYTAAEPEPPVQITMSEEPEPETEPVEEPKAEPVEENAPATTPVTDPATETSMHWLRLTEDQLRALSALTVARVEEAINPSILRGGKITFDELRALMQIFEVIEEELR